MLLDASVPDTPQPVSLEDLKEEVDYARSRGLEHPSGHIVVQTFGNFEIFVDGETLIFHRSKAEELLAYLIDRDGRGVNRPGIYTAPWEEGMREYYRKMYEEKE